MKSLGNIRFIGELYKLNMLTAKIMHSCITNLLNGGDEESLECLCKLLTTVGQILEKATNDDKKYADGQLEEFKRNPRKNDDNKEDDERTKKMKEEETRKNLMKKQQDAVRIFHNSQLRLFL